MPEKSFIHMKSDRYSGLIIFFSLSLLLIAVTSEVFVRRPKYIFPLVLSGFIIFMIGFMLRVIGQLSLGKNFSLMVRIRSDHTLIRKGVYRCIRHPMYTGMFMIAIGICMMLQSILGAAITILILTPVGIYRVKVEEAALRKRFGREYKEYQRKTKRFVPFLF
jgi:protein-S-isoprenylcysteine O-methyltransferase Ste14